MLSPKRRGLVSRLAVAELGVIMRDGRHIGHEFSGVLARGVTFGQHAASGIPRTGSQMKRSALLQAAGLGILPLAPAAE